MQSLIVFILANATIILSFSALLLVLTAFFSESIERAAEQISLQPGRSFLLGLINAILLGSIAVLFISLAENSGLGILSLPALLSIFMLVAISMFALASLTLIIGQRLFPSQDNFKAQWRGSLLLLLASSAPYIGWFILVPFLLFMGFGGVLISVLQSYQSRKKKQH